MPRGGAAAHASCEASQINWLAGKVRVLEGRLATVEAKAKTGAHGSDEVLKRGLHLGCAPGSGDSAGGPVLFNLYDSDADAESVAEEALDVLDVSFMNALDELTCGALKGVALLFEQRLAELPEVDLEVQPAHVSTLLEDTLYVDELEEWDGFSEFQRIQTEARLAAAGCVSCIARAEEDAACETKRIEALLQDSVNARIPTTATMVRGHVFCSWGHRAWQTKCGSRWAPGTSGTCDICFKAIYRRSEIWACDPCNWWACAPCASGILGSDGMKRCGEEFLELSGRPPDAFRQISDVALVKKALKIWMLGTLF